MTDLASTSLAALARDAASVNWDGHGAAPVTLPAPEVSIDPDGEVSFDWYAGPRRTLSMSLDPFGTLRYASIIGGSEKFGLEPWRNGIPESVLRLLQKVVLHDATR